MNDKELTRLIILGAGASVDCGLYPTGAQFIKIVRKILEFPNILDKSKISSELLKRLVEASPPSIDAYISSLSNSKDKVILKALILSILRVCTDYSETYSDKFTDSWYFSIWQLFESELRNCRSDADKIDKLNQIKSFKIITFNYDLSLELFLWKRIDVNFASDLEKHKAMKIISDQIFHVYGSLGDLLELRGNYSNAGHLEFNKLNSFIGCSWSDILNFSANDSAIQSILNPSPKYGGLISAIIQLFDKILKKIDEENITKLSDVVTNLVDGIKVIETERNNKDADLDKITKSQDGWDIIYILGYGFDHFNNELLKLNNIKWKKGCFVTNYAENKSNINQKLERLILDELLSRRSFKNDTFNIPLISYEAVSKALKNDFSLLENPKSPLIITTNLTPWLAMRNK